MVNIPNTGKKRVVIVGCGFAGLNLTKKLRNTDLHVIIVDKHNYHQFQPLLYQVASASIEPSAIAFPLRKIFQHSKNVILRKAEVLQIKPDTKSIDTTLGTIEYDYLVLAHGAVTSFFGLHHVEQCAKPMKSVAEALDLRNTIFQNFENALAAKTPEEKQQFMNLIIVGGGPSGVEIAGALAEMRNNALPKDFPELNCTEINIYLVEATGRLLSSMSNKSSDSAAKFLNQLGVKVLLNTYVKDCDDEFVSTNNQNKIKSSIVIWTAGIKARKIAGLSDEAYGQNERLNVDQYNRVNNYNDIFAIGDVCLLKSEQYPKGHPQVAQVAIQQAKLLAKNLVNFENGTPLIPFKYKDLGSMATIGRNLAVVELPKVHFRGFFAWLVWMFVHLMSIIGVKNKFIILLNWAWYYFTRDQSLRLIIRPKEKK